MTLLCGLIACSDEGVDEVGGMHGDVCEHTIVMYLMADNNLSSSIYQNAIDAEYGMIGASPSVRLVIYLDRADVTELYEVRYLPYGSGKEHIRYCKTLKTYPYQTSTKRSVMREVIEDIKRLTPSQSYGLVMAGHGSGWFPVPSSGTAYHDQKVAPAVGVENSSWSTHSQEYFFPSSMLAEPQTRYMGYDYEESENGVMMPSYISTEDMVEALHPIHFDYIIFDACFMSSVEFLYDMRHTADYIVASPVEIMACGLPYKELISNLASPKHNLANLCDIAKDVYVRDDNFSYVKSLALAVIDCSKLEALADAVQAVYRATGGGNHLEVIEQRVDRSRVQHLDRMTPAAFYDLEDFVCELTDSEPLKAQFESAMSDAIVRSLHTDQIYSLGYSSSLDYNYDYITPIAGESTLSLCGISTYIPFAEAPLTNSLYMETEWAKKVYSEQ